MILGNDRMREERNIVCMVLREILMMIGIGYKVFWVLFELVEEVLGMMGGGESEWGGLEDGGGKV